MTKILHVNVLKINHLMSDILNWHILCLMTCLNFINQEMIQKLRNAALLAVITCCSFLLPQKVVAQTCNPNDGSAANGFCAPQLNTTNSNFTWSQSVNQATGAANVFRLISAGSLTYTIPTSTYPSAFSGPVMIDINDVVSYDGYSSRSGVNQTNERWRVVFKKNGSVLFHLILLLVQR